MKIMDHEVKGVGLIFFLGSPNSIQNLRYFGMTACFSGIARSTVSPPLGSTNSICFPTKSRLCEGVKESFETHK